MEAIAASIFFALHNYIVSYAMVAWHGSSSIVVTEWFVLIAIYIAYHLYLMNKNKKEKGHYWSYQESQVLNFANFQKSRTLFGCILIRAVFVCLATVNVALIAHYAKAAGISPAVMLSLTIFSSFTSAIAFYFIYSEKLNVRHWIGMISIMISVLIIGLAKAQRSQSQSGQVTS